MQDLFAHCFIVVIALLLLVGWVRGSQPTDATVVRSTVDGRDYVVQNKADKQAAADVLAQVRARMIRLVEHLRGGDHGASHIPEDAVRQFGTAKDRFDRLAKRFNPDRISEGNEDTRYTTYTLNKGEKIVFCLRARDEDDRVHDIALMTFVAIHELAHVASLTEHHTPEFQSNFSWLLRCAVDAGVYQPEDFKRRPRRYCGIDVTDSPLSE